LGFRASNGEDKKKGEKTPTKFLITKQSKEEREGDKKHVPTRTSQG